MYNNNDFMGKELEKSKKITPQGILLAIVLGLVATVVTAAMYAILNLKVPFVYANVLFAFAFGFIIAKAITLGAKIGHVTNKKVMYGIGGLFIVIAEYFNWVFWIYAFSEFDFLTFNLSEIIDTIRLVNVFGAWEIKGNAVTGTMLWIVWVAEAFVIGYGIMKTIKSFYEKNSYCNACGVWVKSTDMSVEIESHGDKKFIKTQFLAGDFSAIDSMEPIIDDQLRTHWRLDLKVCEQCMATYILDVVEVKVGKNHKANNNISESFIVNNVHVDSSIHEKMEALMRNSKQSASGVNYEYSDNDRDNDINI